MHDYEALAVRIAEQVSATIPKWSDRYPFDGIHPDLILLAHLRGEHDRAREMLMILEKRPDGNWMKEVKICRRVVDGCVFERLRG